MSSADQAASAASALRHHLRHFNVVQQVDIGVDLDESYFVRVWVTHRTREVLAQIPREIGGVSVQLASV